MKCDNYITLIVFMIFLTSFNNFSSSFANPDEDLINEALPVTETLPVAVELNYQESNVQHDAISNDESAVACEETQDLVIVMDSSGSMGVGNYEILRNFAAELVGFFGTNPKTKQGLLIYSGSTFTLYDLSSEMNPAEMKIKIKEQPYEPGPSYTHLGIQDAVQMLLQKTEEGTPQKILILTDGESTYKSLTKRAGKLAKNASIKVFALGIGSDLDQEFDKDLFNMVGERRSSIFRTHNFTTLSKSFNVVTTEMCKSRTNSETDEKLDFLFPFGPDAGDTEVTHNFPKCLLLKNWDQGWTVDMLGKKDPWICSEGFISTIYLGQGRLGGLSDNTCQRIFTHHVIMPFVNYIDSNADGGTVTHRLTYDAPTLDKIKAHLAPIYPESGTFKLDLKWAYVITWFNKASWASSSTAGCAGLDFRNTVQAILAGGEQQTFSIFKYKQLQWTAPPPGCPTTNPGIVAPVNSTSGFASGGVFGKAFYLPGSCSDDGLKLASTSNVGIPGVWAYRIDGTEVLEKNP